MKIELNSFEFVKFLSASAAVLILLNIIMLIIYFHISNPDKFDFIQLVDLDQEANIPTLFSSIILLISSMLFYLLSRLPAEQKKNNQRYWFWLGIIFLFLSFDESATIHESIGDFTSKFIHADGFLYYPWIIAYGIILVILSCSFFRFFWRMEKKVFFQFMLSAGIYLGGAIGFDLLGSREISLHGGDTILYCIYYTIEESLEMFGVIYLIWILSTLLNGCTIEIGTGENQGSQSRRAHD